jgi:membrane fusion protein (multidrug efflux system)
VDSTASRIDIEKRSLAARVKLNNSNLEILPGSLLEITIKYNIHDSLGVPDTSVMLEGNKVYIYKVNKDNLAKKKEIKIGLRNNGYLEVISGLNEGETIVAEGLKKVRPNSKIKPIKK